MFRPRSQVGPFLNLTHDWSARPWAHTNSSFEHLPGVAILELGEAQVTERRTQSPRGRPAPTVTGCTRRHFLDKALLSEDLNPLATSSVITARASHTSSPSPRCLSGMASSVDSRQRSRYWLVGPILGTSLRATAGHLLPRLLPASRRRRP